LIAARSDGEIRAAAAGPVRTSAKRAATAIARFTFSS
jgi:hypothetical protein